MFRIGQKVVCVESTPSKPIGDNYVTPSQLGVKLIKGEIYTVIGLWRCKCELSINVGLHLPYERIDHTQCPKCRESIKGNSAWAGAYRFRPIDEAFGENVAAAFEEQFAFETAIQHRTEYASAS